MALNSPIFISKSSLLTELLFDGKAAYSRPSLGSNPARRNNHFILKNLATSRAFCTRRPYRYPHTLLDLVGLLRNLARTQFRPGAQAQPHGCPARMNPDLRISTPASAGLYAQRAVGLSPRQRPDSLPPA